MIAVAKSMLFFVMAALFELGGAYLIWMWVRGGKSPLWGLVGAAVLVTYAMMHTLQPAHYGRIQAAYSGMFIIMALLWAWQVDRIVPDRYDLIGGAVALAGMLIIMYWPR